MRTRSRRGVWAVCLAVGAAGCTSVNTATVPLRSLDGDRGDAPFVLSGDLKQPYQSVGLVQVTRRGVLLFGFADPAGTDLTAGFAELVTRVREMGGDGAINVHWTMTQYTVPSRIFGAIFFFLPLPSELTVTGEVVRLQAPSLPVGPTHL